MSLDTGLLASKMFEAFKEKLSDKWPDVKDYAEAESRKLAENFIMIEKLKLKGQITEEQARLHHEIQRNASRSVLLTIEGLGLVAVEQAVNAAMGTLKETVNEALDFALL
ncbi:MULTISPECIES: hypothetical protein [Vibrio]|uniref:hypothetical protein n=1 Tax=Vibrio TaxID=662 RepID=UPI001BD3E3D0|nr:MULTISPECIES: hypothetical protein [Vibrio]MBS9965072.1 hypothetical protein [Vibrio alginolyticus]MDW1535906.1 hypothetical protein [Vibrio sp. Y159]